MWCWNDWEIQPWFNRNIFHHFWDDDKANENLFLNQVKIENLIHFDSYRFSLLTQLTQLQSYFTIFPSKLTTRRRKTLSAIFMSSYITFSEETRVNKKKFVMIMTKNKKYELKMKGWHTHSSTASSTQLWSTIFNFQVSDISYRWTD